MKLNKLIFPLVIALTATTLAVTGCKKGPTRMTNLPGQNGAPVDPFANQSTIPNTPPYDPNARGLGFNDKQPVSFETSTNGSPDDMNQDHQALAAYTVHFKFDSAAVLDNEQANITAVAGALTQDANAKLLIEGNCDERGTEEYNRSLGERRALALREALAKAGIDPQRVFTRSYGKDKPVDPGHDDAAFAKNRRGDFVLCHPK